MCTNKEASTDGLDHNLGCDVFLGAEVSADRQTPTFVGANAAWLWLEPSENRKFRIYIDDQVEGECWTDAERTKSLVRSKLGQFGWQEGYGGVSITLSGLGQRTGAVCQIAWDYSVNIYSEVIIGLDGKISEYREIEIWSTRGLLFNHSRDRANNVMKENFIAATEDFILEQNDKYKIVMDFMRHSGSDYAHIIDEYSR